MAKAIPRILVVEANPDVAELLEVVLNLEGYEVPWLGDDRRVVEEIHRRRPDLVLVDVPPVPPERIRVLDVLRTDRTARRIPALVTTTSRSMADAARASFNVCEVLLQPFELPNLTRKVRDCLGQRPLYAEVPPEVVPPAGILAEAERVLVAYCREALVRWVQRLQQQGPWRGRSDLHLPQLIDHVPVLIEVLTVALHYGDPDVVFQRHPELKDRVAEHTRTRQRQGIPLEAVLREYTLLRDDVWATLWDHLPRQLHIDEVRRLQQVVGGTLDRIIEVTIPDYLLASGQTAA